MLFHLILNQKNGGKKMRMKLALLVFLLLFSMGMAYTVSVSDAFKELALGVFGSDEIRINEAIVITKLSADQMAKAVEIVFGNPQVQEILEGVDDYQTSVSDVFELQEIEVGDKGKGIALIPKEGLAMVEIRTYKDYGEEFGIKVVNVTVDLLKGEVKEIEDRPEVFKLKIHEGIISIDELLDNPSEYQGQVVTVSGTVSALGELFGPYFILDGELTICYWDMTSEDTNIYPTQIKDKIQNGDHVLVTGKFLNNIVYAEKVEKAAS